MIAAARLVLSGDTGVAHVASAFATPSVVRVGPVSTARWGPPARDRHRTLWPAPDPHYRGDPHGSAPDPVLLRRAQDLAGRDRVGRPWSSVTVDNRTR